MNRPYLSIFLLIGALFFSCKDLIDPPQPYGPVPTADQLAWQKMEYYMFVHFGPNTFTNVEWGNGKEDPRVFNPTDLGCRQWVATAKAAGMKGIIITAKHHDGFCLWPSQYSTHTVRESPWKDGKGDVLKELSQACREGGLKFGVYLSPWDQNHPTYGTLEYNQLFANTLTEVLTGYGDVFEQWFDGANGEGADGKKQAYDWELFHQTVYKNQPHAVIFSDVGPGCRWIGNEQGYAGETNWSRLNITGFEPGLNAPPTDVLNNGNEQGEAWVPGEADVSIRPGWFYSPSTDDKQKTLNQLVDIYYASVGHNSNLLLNVPPDRRGHIHPNDSIRLIEFNRVITESFKTNLLKGAIVKADSYRGNSSRFAAERLLDGDYDSYWATEDSVLTASVELDLKKEQTSNRLILQEYIPLGQRVAQFNVEYWDGKAGNWKPLAEATTIGYKRILCFPLITAQRFRINILRSLACPVLNNLELYQAPE
jgi:alpha-L-fucosidase